MRVCMTIKIYMLFTELSDTSTTVCCMTFVSVLLLLEDRAKESEREAKRETTGQKIEKSPKLQVEY